MTLARPLTVAAIVSAVAVLTGCAGQNAVDATAGSSGKRYVAGDGTVRVLAAGERRAVADVRGTTLDGRSLDLASYRGKVVVVNFWASWCPPCRAEAEGLEAVYRQTRADGVQFVGVDIKDDAAQARIFVRRHGITYPSLSDQPGVVALRFRGLPPNAIPTTIVLDRSGREAARVSGPVTYTRLLSLVRDIAGGTT